MTDTVSTSTSAPSEPVPPDTRGGLRTALLAILAIAVVVVAVSAGFVWGRGNGSSSSSVSAVDAGFARDMATHHQQAITMATYTETNSTDPAIEAVAYDIETSQSVQLGIMTGWLEQWNVSRNTNSPMAWMKGHAHHIGPNGLMPGMATPAQMTRLQTLHGTALNVFFLQLMIRHHQGGVTMAQYAAAAAIRAVRTGPRPEDVRKSERGDRPDGTVAASARRLTAAAAARLTVARVLARLARFAAPVAQGIEHRPPEAVAQVRILPGALTIRGVVGPSRDFLPAACNGSCIEWR